MSNDETIKVLIVDDIAETRENIRKLLQFEVDFEIVGAARNGQEGIELAKELRPDVILMDINMPDIDGITATETIRSEVPESQIVILTVQADPNYMRRAMLAGAPVTETVFNWPGVGRLFVDAIVKLDFPVIMGITVFITIMTLVANLITDLTYGYIDPRIRVE